MSTMMSWLVVIVIVGIIVLVLGALFIIKCVSMYKKSEKDKKYDDILSKPLEKMGTDGAEELAKKYEQSNKGE